MAYLTQQDLVARVGGDPRFLELTDDDHDGNPDPAVLEQLLDMVDDEANGFFLAGGYTVPLTPDQVEVVYTQLLDIANYRAKIRGDRQPTADDTLTYQNAISFLKGVGTNKLSLTPIPEIGSGFGLDSYPQLFNRCTLKTY